MSAKPCSFALSHLNQQLLHSRISSCYRSSEKWGDFTSQKMSEVINGSAAREHRMKLMSGVWPEGCSSCRNIELRGQISTRLRSNSDHNMEELQKNFNPNNGEIRALKSIELRFGNECNLACRHCNMVHSSRWEAMIERDPSLLGRLHREAEVKSGPPVAGFFEDIIENIVPGGLELILFSGGETLMQKAHYRFIDSIPKENARNISLSYVTNGTIRTLPGWNLPEIWRRFKKVSILVSTDGIGERFEYFRVGAKWKTVEENMKFWRAEGFQVTATITCSAYQMFYLPETIEYIHENKLANLISTTLVQYPPVINPRIIPVESKTLIKKEWDEYLSQMGDDDKLREVIRAGQNAIDYMLGEELHVYDLPNGHLPTWSDFQDQTAVMDELFKTNIAGTFPKVAATFTEPSLHSRTLP